LIEFPLTPTLSPAFAEAASRRQAQGERGFTLFPSLRREEILISPPLMGGDEGEGEPKTNKWGDFL